MLRLKKVTFIDSMSPELVAGRNSWLSVFALGGEAFSSCGYFEIGVRCDGPRGPFDGVCDLRAQFGTKVWHHEQCIDLAFVVGIAGVPTPRTP